MFYYRMFFCCFVCSLFTNRLIDLKMALLKVFIISRGDKSAPIQTILIRRTSANDVPTTFFVLYIYIYDAAYGGGRVLMVIIQDIIRSIKLLMSCAIITQSINSWGPRSISYEKDVMNNKPTGTAIRGWAHGCLANLEVRLINLIVHLD